MIALLSIVPIIVTSISGALGLFVLILSLRGKKDRIQISFAFIAFSVMLYAFATTELYNASNLADATIWQRMQISTIFLFCHSFSKYRILEEVFLDLDRVNCSFNYSSNFHFPSCHLEHSKK